MYKNYDIKEVIEENKNIVDESKVIEALFATKAKNKIEFHIEWNRTHTPKVNLSDIEPIIDKFEADILLAKAEADSGKIPTDVRFVGKFEVKK